MEQEQKKKDSILILIIIFIVIIILLLGWRFFTGNKKVATSSKILVDCTANLDSKPESVKGWKTWLYPAVPASPMPYPESKTDLQASYSTSKLFDHTETSNVYYRIEMDPRADLPRETRKIMEVCDQNNKTVQFGTTKDTKVQGASENVKASTSIISPAFISGQSEQYRIDGFIYTNGTWTLTDRIDSIRITR
ncbi:MAG: hypothetical protein WCL07_00880 [bacterium]